ncbi:MAG: sodium-dependent transporter [Solobacterium sp.]|nr:sodium-dependent transporter [Solobacterium sp.]
MNDNQRGSFTGKLGFVLSAAGASVGLGNIWRFPYLAAKYGGGIFLLVYVILALTFGYTMIVAETSIGRATGKSPVGAFCHYSHSVFAKFGGWLNAIIPLLIVPYYSVIGGWVAKYLYEYCAGHEQLLVQDGYFTSFISNGYSPEFWFILFALVNLVIILLGVENGIERVSGLMMPILVVLAVILCVYIGVQPGALKGIQYFLVPNFKNFSLMTIVSAMGQMFYSLSIAMGILITFGSYMKKDTSIDRSTIQVEIFDTGIAVMAGLMIIPAVFVFSGGSPESLQGGPSLMFVTMPKVFMQMPMGRWIGILFFALVLLAALTSAIALTETIVSTWIDQLHGNRKTGVIMTGAVMLALGTLSCMGYGPLSFIKILGMEFLDFFDFLTNSLMMPVSALAICFLVTKCMGINAVEAEVIQDGHPFGRKKIFTVMIRYVCPVFIVIILLSSIANVLGWIHM